MNQHGLVSVIRNWALDKDQLLHIGRKQNQIEEEHSQTICQNKLRYKLSFLFRCPHHSLQVNNVTYNERNGLVYELAMTPTRAILKINQFHKLVHIHYTWSTKLNLLC